MDKVSVLVTGSGGALGVAIIKALRMAHRYQIIGVNSLPWGAGLFLADRGVVVPEATNPDYIPRLIEIIREENVRAVLCGTHHDLLLLSTEADRIKRETGAVVIVSPPDVLTIGHDKWRTAGWLKEQGLNYPRPPIWENWHTPGAKILVKPRCTAGSRGVVIAEDQQTLERALQDGEDKVVQEYLEGPEYTVGGFWVPGEGLAGLIAMRRELEAGSTKWGVVDQNPDVLCYCQSIVEALQPMGPVNIQLRLTKRGPVAFDLNVRFSTTTVARAHFGFPEVDLAVSRFALGLMGPTLKVEPGFFVRHYEEIYRKEEP